MEALILAGGEGTRLRPYTFKTPKPLLVVHGKPMMQYVLENLKKHGIKKCTLTVGYRKEQIINHFGNGSSLGIDISYLIEDEPRKTAGSIVPKKDAFHETFVVVMGDTINDIDLKKMSELHKKSKALATMCVVKHETKIEYGVVNLTGHYVESFLEKPVLAHYINAGTYLFEPEIFDFIKGKEDFAKDVFPRLLKEGKKIAVYVHEGTWQDIGRVSDYEALKK